MKKTLLFVVAMLVSVMASAKSIRADVLEAINLYSTDVVYGFTKSLEFRGEEVSAEKQAELLVEIKDFCLKRQLPVLVKMGLLEDWISCQRDPRMQELRKRTREAKNAKALQRIIAEEILFIQAYYPTLLRYGNTPECKELMIELIKRIQFVYIGWKQ